MLMRVQKDSSTYAVYGLDNFHTQIDKVSVMMINSNQNHAIGLAPITFEEMNGIYYKMLFDVTGKITLGEYIGRHITQEDFRLMLLNLIDTIEQFDEYMIDVGQVLLDMDCVYINTIDHSVAFLCIALQGELQSYQLHDFFRTVLQHSHVNSNLNEVSYFHHVWNVVNSENGFSLHNIRTAMTVSQQQENKSVSQKNQSVQIKGTPNQKIEEPSIITVPSLPKVPDYQKQNIPAPATEQEEKKNGFLSKFFSGSKKKKTEQSSDGYQSGLAGLKNGINKEQGSHVHQNEKNQGLSGLLQQQTQKTNPESQILTAPALTMPSHAYQQNIPQGTVVLNQQLQQEYRSAFGHGKPAEEYYQGTTVLNKQMQQEYHSSVIQENPVRDYYQGTTVLNKKSSESIGTTVLNKAYSPDSDVKYMEPPKPAVKTACLIRIKNHYRTLINKPVIVIGRDADGLDCNISDNTNISHYHAKIIQRGNAYYILDLHSSNFTYVNQRRLFDDMELMLSDMDRIHLADEEFEFRIM